MNSPDTTIVQQPPLTLLYRGWIPTSEADDLLARLLGEVAWEQRTLRMFGRDVREPRLSAWIGDADAVYTWSKRRNEPLPWTPSLAAVRDRVAAELKRPFNAVLCNLYRDGDDAMGMHTDNEPELGPEPVLASVSLGAARTFRVRPKDGGEGVDTRLGHGDLLVLSPEVQHAWKHGVPRERKVNQPRVNLTFRWIAPASP